MTQSVPSSDRIAAAGATAPDGHASPAGSLQGGAESGARTDGSAEEVFVDFRDAGFTYDGERFVFRHLDLTVPQGQFLCLLGGNGSGKSTLAKHVNALLLPDEGEVRVFGCDTRDPEQTYFIRSNAGLVFQNPDDQIVASLIENDVAFGPENLGVPNPELRERVTRALAEVGLMGFEEHETHALSGGQKQRVAIAGVLAMDPAILILDEATAMLDPRGRAGLMRVVRELHAAGMTVVMITHYMEEAAAAERVVVLDGGAVVLDGAPAEVLTRADELRALSLEVPFACRLSLDLQARGVPVRTCVSDDELKEELCALRSKM
ncbi:energy-coupling factor transporter ATPase [Adlercreutzia caecimuris]|uniref:energy-coupling factor transporter ATPase n=1 Tax=Adlercreutzia caecimuris TaxID=671266 RepID=UPI00272B12A0|nr:energy-coupling factor transporter ATPase [Adlercreutzia caecimuris]